MYVSTENNSWKYSIPLSLLNSTQSLETSHNFFISETKYFPNLKNKYILHKNNLEKIPKDNIVHKNIKSNNINLPILGKDLYLQQLYRKRNIKRKGYLKKENKSYNYEILRNISRSKRKDLSNISNLQFQYMNTLFKDNISKDKIGSKQIYISGAKVIFKNPTKKKITLPKPIYTNRRLNFLEIANK